MGGIPLATSLLIVATTFIPKVDMTDTNMTDETKAEGGEKKSWTDGGDAKGVRANQSE